MNQNRSSQQNLTPQNGNICSPSTYIVCLIDVLGQKDELSQWVRWPEDSVLEQKAARAWRKSVGVVKGFEKRFLKAFDQMSICTMPETLASVSPQEQATYHRYKKCMVNVQQFSDTFVFYTPLVTDCGDISIVGLYRVLGACCIAMLPSLCQRVPIRGGITIGLASELGPAKLYGPALNEAHYLENEVAQYPRIVVSDQVYKNLAPDQIYSDDTEVNKRISRLAKSARNLICPDTDGNLIVDYLGSTVKDILLSTGGFPIVQFVDFSYKFVRSEAFRFEKERNDKLASRYRKLQKYFLSRLSLYGLPED